MPAVVIPGRPVPKGRPRIGTSGTVYTPKPTRDYEQAVAWAVRASRGRVEGDCEVFITIRGKTQRGDIDNIAKALLDGLEKGGGITNDRQVVRLDVRWVQGEPEQAELVWDRALPEAA